MAFSLSPRGEFAMVPFTEQHPQSHLEKLLVERILADDPLPFAKFMEECLYHPAYGYYMTTRQRIGRDGDFFTSSSVHTLFGQLIARQLHQMWEILGCPSSFVIAEQGAGEGHLCLDILNALEADFPEFYSSLLYRIVEISDEKRARQAQLLLGLHKAVNWCQQNDLAGMIGCYLSNELIDAFPVHLVEKRDGKFHEVYVAIENGTFHEVLQAPSTEELANYLEWVGVELAEGNRAEINLAAPLWMRTVAGLLRRGFILTIDYGYLAGELYAPWRTPRSSATKRKKPCPRSPEVRVGTILGMPVRAS
jgi:SAM-dependent MidA family methyltransferase